MEKFWRLAVWMTLTAVLCACTDDVLDASYSAQSEAVTSGAVERGWIPAWVPPGAKDLREVHDVDTNESALSFTLPAGAKWRPPAQCRTADAGEFSEPRFDRSWIPENLDGYDVYNCPSDVAGGSVPITTAVAIERGGTHVLHWRVFAR